MTCSESRRRDHVPTSCRTCRLSGRPDSHYPCMRTLSLHAHFILACAHYPCMRTLSLHAPCRQTPAAYLYRPAMLPLPPVDGSIAPPSRRWIHRPPARPPARELPVPFSRCLSRGRAAPAASRRTSLATRRARGLLRCRDRLGIELCFAVPGRPAADVRPPLIWHSLPA